jgi:hypothetical protein
MRHSRVVKSFILIAGATAISGAGVLALTRSNDVRGDTPAGEPVARAEGMPETRAPAHEETEDWRAYMLGLEADDYTTYTDPVHGISFDYPKEFKLRRATWEDEEVRPGFLILTPVLNP